MVMAADFLTKKEGPGVGNGGAGVVVVERAVVAAPELRVGHHLWRWNIDYFWIFRTANPLSVETLSTPSELLPSSLTKNKTRIH